MQYTYDENGLVESVSHRGWDYELTDAEKQFVPGKSLPKTKSLQTNLNSTVEDLKNSWTMRDSADEESILIDVEATHGGYYNKNYYYYLASGMKEMVDTWTNHGGRPYLINHDRHSEPRGRVRKAEFVSTGEETGFHALDVEVGDSDEIDMIIDGRALHVSVGSRPVDSVNCRICGHDIYHDGKTPIRYELSGEPSREIRKKKAPGYFGTYMNMDNEDYWKIEESEEGQWTALCRHIRSYDAPMGGDEEKKVGWRLSAQRYKELSRVNMAADRNDETGEFAHIREIIKNTEEMEDSAAEKYVAEELARIEDSSPVNHARMNIARENDLWRPRNPTKAVDWAEKKEFNAMFDKSLWTTINALNPEKEMEDKVEEYWEEGGRFIDRGEAFDDSAPSGLSVSDALQLDDAKEFGQWLRSQDFDRQEKRMLDRIHAKNYFGDRN